MNEEQKQKFVNGYYDFYKEHIVKTNLNKLMVRLKYFLKYNRYMKDRRIK